MRNIATAVAVIGIIVVAACGNKDATPAPTAPTAGGYPPGQYPPPGTPGYPPPAPGYPPTAAQPGYPPPPGPTPPPGPAPGPAPAAMSVPGPLAAPCNADGASCGTHHCNTQYQKCAFPCQNADADCIAPNGCVLGLCVPKLPGT
jgi:hypothetical protein